LKTSVPQIAKKFPAFLEIEGFDCVRNSPPFFPILSSKIKNTAFFLRFSSFVFYNSQNMGLKQLFLQTALSEFLIII
jgi:hypothetical protein